MVERLAEQKSVRRLASERGLAHVAAFLQHDEEVEEALNILAG
jgi:hypothetical protein